MSNFTIEEDVREALNLYKGQKIDQEKRLNILKFYIDERENNLGKFLIHIDTMISRFDENVSGFVFSREFDKFVPLDTELRILNDLIDALCIFDIYDYILNLNINYDEKLFKTSKLPNLIKNFDYEKLSKIYEPLLFSREKYHKIMFYKEIGDQYHLDELNNEFKFILTKFRDDLELTKQKLKIDENLFNAVEFYKIERLPKRIEAAKKLKDSSGIEYIFQKTENYDLQGHLDTL